MEMPPAASAWGVSDPASAVAPVIKRIATRGEHVPSVFTHTADLVTALCQSEVGVVWFKPQPILGAGGEHAIGLRCAERGEIVDHDTKIRVRPIEGDTWP